MTHALQLTRRKAVQAALASAAVAIPGGNAAAQDATPASTPANDGNGISRDQVNAAIGKLEVLIADAMSRIGLPGTAVAVVHDGEVVFEKGFGVREIGKSEQVTPETVFQLASMSKAISSTVMAAVIGDGLTTWDTVAAEGLPGFAMSDPWLSAQVTLRDLFAHRSGLPAYAGDSLSATFGYGRDESVRRLRYVKPGSPVRSGFAYTNLGLSVAAYAAAEASGMAWEDLATKRLLAQLGMENTGYRNTDYTNRANKAAPHYREADGTWALGAVTDADPAAPAGGVSSSLHDLTKWMRLQLGGGLFEDQQIVAEEALMETRRPQILAGSPPNPADGPASFYGLGWYLAYDDKGRLQIHHLGDFSDGFRTSVNLLPTAGLGIVVLTNAWPNPLPDALPRAFFEFIELGEATQDWIEFYASQTDAGLDAVRQLAPIPQGAVPADEPALALDAYLGSFSNELYGEITTRIDGDQLVIDLGPQPYTFPLTHWSRDVFTYPLPPRDEALVGQLAIRFMIGPDGKATEIAFGLPTVGPDGTALFTRVDRG